MKLSETTLETIKNFATIQTGMVFNPGNFINTCSSAKNIMVEAETEETFDKTFGIYDLSEFLGVFSLFKENPDIKFNDKDMVIGTANESIKYRYTDPEMIIHETKRVKLPNVDFELSITKENLDALIKAMNILKSPMVVLESDGKLLSFATYDPQNNSAHVYRQTLSKAKNSKKFKAVCGSEHMKMLSNLDYDVYISSQGLIQYSNKDRKYSFNIRLDEKSEL